ncbi:MAG: 1-deoxy-D-xylulose-5-phosphate reductoisomerase [Christensenellaceae bacterium]
MKKIAILGATGSIGQQAQDVVRRYSEDFKIVAMTAHRDAEGLVRAANEFRPEYVCLTDAGKLNEVKNGLVYGAHVLCGPDSLLIACADSGAELVVLAVMGIAGLPAFYECLKRNIDVALANKEALVSGAGVTRKLMDDSKSTVLPVDSEHSAIFQCLGNSYDISDVQRIYITASGGPFLHEDADFIYNAPVGAALKHPNWEMGKKITIDSASLANKGLEVIEAHYLYKAPPDMISVVVHPESIIHSLVELKDASVMAQLALPDMRLPLQKAMFFPEIRDYVGEKRMDLLEVGKLTFLPPDTEKFPCLALAYQALRDNATAVYNVSNEVAVSWYLEERIKFGQIPEIILLALQTFGGTIPTDLNGILELDKEVRAFLDGKRAVIFGG